MGVLRKNTLILNYLCRASQELNGIFSVPVFILLTAKFISVVTTAFAYIYNSFIRSNVLLNSYSWLFLFIFFTDWIKMLILLTTADMPVNQVVTQQFLKCAWLPYFVLSPDSSSPRQSYRNILFWIVSFVGRKNLGSLLFENFLLKRNK